MLPLLKIQVAASTDQFRITLHTMDIHGGSNSEKINPTKESVSSAAANRILKYLRSADL
jgi:hypothetical protein